MAMHTYVPFDFIEPLQPGKFNGPCYEVRRYGLSPMARADHRTVAQGGSRPLTVSPVLATMTSVTGAVTRFLHIWPYQSFDERARLQRQGA